jgi:hypothetical protein
MSIAAGWYADPAGPGTVRWWDGAAWTTTTAPMPPPPPSAAPTPYVAPYVAPYGAVADDAGWNPMDLLVPRARSLGVRALIWGIVGVVLPIAFLPAVMALVFGAMGLDHARRLQAAGWPADRRVPIAGIVLGAVSLVAVFAFIVIASALRG